MWTCPALVLLGALSSTSRPLRALRYAADRRDRQVPGGMETGRGRLRAEQPQRAEKGRDTAGPGRREERQSWQSAGSGAGGGDEGAYFQG